ncbi:hypothetical protein DL96DRAFT_1631268 [Flagelloscypha sp. PMI_526]|nr:hypothetical protein DL96DRAFT_1631268 [Flagelloscypha sp. PMI_526]
MSHRIPLNSSNPSVRRAEENSNQWLSEINSFAEELAKNAKLPQKYRPGKDAEVNENEQRKLKMQLHAMDPLPEWFRMDMWSSFAAQYLPTLHSCLQTVSMANQRAWGSWLLSILSLMGSPQENLYLLKYVLSPDGHHLAQLAGSMIGNSETRVQFLRPSGPGQLAQLVTELVFWCPPSVGDDSKAAINKSTRDALEQWATELAEMDSFERFPEDQRSHILKLIETMKAINDMPDSSLVDSIRDSYELSLGGPHKCNGKPNCEGDAQQRCGKCQTVAYCGQDCQRWAWKNGHKMRCHVTEY